ncbi:hypothetical protein I4U23_002913 [Adineta vaga]|nr:hypothetical protein I4U23_002913 [Adineta vaga]
MQVIMEYQIFEQQLNRNFNFWLIYAQCLWIQSPQTQTDFDNDEFITINLLPEEQIQSELNVAINNVQNSISTRIISFLNYIRIYVRSNYIASALNTNLMLATYLDGKQYTIYQLQTQYTQDTSISLSTTLTMMCGSQNPIIPTGFFPIPIIYGIFTRNRWPTNVADFIPVKGFYTACTALEALLASTFDCLYDIRCIQLLPTKFPSLNLRDFNVTNLTLASNQQNITVYDHLLKLFIQDWSTEISYPKYFNACAPASCSYIIENESNLSYAFAIFISLYGGLIIILRLMSPVLIKILLKMKQCLTGRIVHVGNNIDHRSPDDIKQQKITTRVYLFLLACSFMILITFTSLETQVVSITVSNPSLTTYNKLEKLYSDTLRCPCSITAVPYDRFMTLSPTLHQICSSDFVKDRWLTIVQSAADYTTEDWRNRAYSQHQLLSHLCQLARNTIDDAVQQFLLQSFIVSSVLSQSEFNTQLNATLNQLFEVTIHSFGSLIDIAALFTQVDQPYLGARKPNWEAVPDKFLTGDIFAIFNLFGTTYVNLSSVNCICAKNSACQTPVAVYQMDSIWNSRIHAYINTYYQNVEFSTWFDPNPLVYDPKSSRYPPDTTVSTIVEQIMIERWNPSYSYKDFYQICAPKSCTYYQRANAKSIFEVIITFISMIGGLTLALKLITPLFIKLIGGLLTVIVRKPRQKIEQTVTIRRSTSDQMKTTVKNVVVYVYDQAINMNIFSMRDLGSNIDRNTAKQLGKWATRLHIALFIVGLAILTLHTSIQPQTVTRIFNKPSFNSYNKLRKEYGDQLKCSCSVIASKYNQFVQIEPIYHQICKSQFTSDQWRNDVTSGLTSNLSMYEQRDYRRFLSAHLQYLQGLCQLSIRSIDNAIEQFLTSLFITNELLSNDTFHARLSFLIEQEKSNAPNTFIRLFFLMRSINQGNAYVTTYGTNFEYVSPWFADTTYYPVFLSRAIIYDNNCSCGIHSNCTVPANIIGVNGTVISSVKGLKMGCTPITVIIGLQGGLTIVLAWICPKFIRILANLNKYRKKRLN